MSIEQKVNQLLQKAPWVKKAVKRSYQLGMYAISPKVKVEGEVERVTPIDDGYEYFFGYYDKSPWNASEQYMLALRTKSTTTSVAPKEKAEIVLIDRENSNKVRKLTETKAWNVQQGAMLQWLGPDFSTTILFNDFREGKYVAVKHNIQTSEETVIDSPVYTVSEDGKTALTLDFARLHRLRPGYGYPWKEDETKNHPVPDTPAIWRVDLETGQNVPLISYKELVQFETRDDMHGADHKVNHLMLNPSGTRFMLLHRWVKGSARYTRLLTLNVDGSELYNLSDDNMASHSYWKNEDEIVSYLRKEKEGNGYFLLKDKTQEYTQVLKDLESAGDGHPSFSPNREKLITDTYPNRQRLQSLFVADAKELTEPRNVAKVFAPFKYDNDVRCDLHPRWDRKGEKVCIDATFEGKRGMYVVQL